MTTTRTAPPSTGRGIAMSVLVTLVVSGVVNTAVSFAAQALGADAGVVMGLQPQLYLLFTLVGAMCGAVAWQVVRRRAADPVRVLRRLVPVVVALSLIPDVLVAVTMSAVGGIALAVMHLVVAGVAVTALRRLLPLDA